ncbi:hypothetical protein Hanom_Chr14g01310011 [Helianthus anomalus]
MVMHLGVSNWNGRNVVAEVITRRMREEMQKDKNGCCKKQGQRLFSDFHEERVCVFVSLCCVPCVMKSTTVGP